MLSYTLRRLIASVFILLGASFIVYLLVAYSGNPLADILSSNAPNKAAMIQQRSKLLRLDLPPAARYFVWLGGASRCVVPFAAQCDLGVTLKGQPVTAALASAVPSTLQLVTGAALLAIVLGIAIGVVTALRQYSALDYGVTFITFLFFSLPIFWVAVLLKEFGAIGFNNFLAQPHIGSPTIAVIAVITGLVLAVIVAGSLRRRAVTFVIAALVAAGVLTYLSATHWFSAPSLGPVVITVTGVAIAYASTVLLADGAPDGRSAIPANPSRGADSGRAEVITSHNDAVVVRVATDRPAYLVTSDAYWPGWRAYLDGREVPLLRANVTGRAIALVDPGVHQVEFRFEPPGFATGLLLSIGAALICVIWLGAGIVTRRR